MKDRKYIRNAKNEDHDKVMIEWVRQCRSEGVPLTGPMLMAQAKIFHEVMGIQEECSYSTGWLKTFKKRHGMRQLSICGDRAEADTEAAEKLIEDFEELIRNDDSSPEQVYNADETGLFWRYVPRKTLAAAEEKNPTGVKDCKVRMTIMACANAAGPNC
ncbi:tigger transposable element-derived protein 2-like [Parasteatoda tepidariorum]|uniref:tigger transposable element-derived protein 2-like n=1 Tax=Parasteatoda tepidariorum TaxID=114398 RepID=UPI0039BD5152